MRGTQPAGAGSRRKAALLPDPVGSARDPPSSASHGWAGPCRGCVAGAGTPARTFSRSQSSHLSGGRVTDAHGELKSSGVRCCQVAGTAKPSGSSYSRSSRTARGSGMRVDSCKGFRTMKFSHHKDAGKCSFRSVIKAPTLRRVFFYKARPLHRATLHTTQNVSP